MVNQREDGTIQLVTKGVRFIQRRPRLLYGMQVIDAATRSLYQWRLGRWVVNSFLLCLMILPIIPILYLEYLLAKGTWSFSVTLVVALEVFILWKWRRVLGVYFDFTGTLLLGIGGGRHYAPIFIVEKRWWNWKEANTYHLHDGTTFDYWQNIRWRERGQIAKCKIMLSYLHGLLAVVQDIKHGGFRPDARFVLTTYFISLATMKRLGFSEGEPSEDERQHLTSNFYKLVLKKSYANGTLTYPDLSKIKRGEISASELIQREDKIKRLIVNVEEYTNRILNG